MSEWPKVLMKSFALSVVWKRSFAKIVDWTNGRETTLTTDGYTVAENPEKFHEPLEQNQQNHEPNDNMRLY